MRDLSFVVHFDKLALFENHIKHKSQKWISFLFF